MQVTIRQFVKDLQAGLNQLAVNRSIQLGKGQCKDHPEYMRAVGTIAGLDQAGGLADSMLRQLEEADRDADLPQMDDGK